MRSPRDGERINLHVCKSFCHTQLLMVLVAAYGIETVYSDSLIKHIAFIHLPLQLRSKSASQELDAPHDIHGRMRRGRHTTDERRLGLLDRMTTPKFGSALLAEEELVYRHIVRW